MKRLSALSCRLFGGLLAVSQSLRNGLPSRAQRLARALAVAVRGVQRDLEYLRDELGLGAGRDSACRRDFPARPGVAHPQGLFAEGETLSVFVSRQTPAARGGTAMERIHAERIRRRESRFDGGQRPWPGQLAPLASVRAPAPEDLSLNPGEGWVLPRLSRHAGGNPPLVPRRNLAPRMSASPAAAPTRSPMSAPTTASTPTPRPLRAGHSSPHG